jgi:hypothetical protein
MFYLLLSLQIYFLVQEVSGSLQILLKCEFTLTYCALAIFCEQILASQVSTCSKKSIKIKVTNKKEVGESGY